MGKKTKIVLDADVIIHFVKGGVFSLLPEIFPEYEYIILDVVYDEVSKYKVTKNQIDNHIHHLSKIKQEKFSPQQEAARDYFQMQRTFGRGESACMIYCRDNKDVLGSSNLRDIKTFCDEHGITYLTTLDFLYYAFCRGKMSDKECHEFIEKVNASGSKLPVVDITRYTCTVAI